MYKGNLEGFSKIYRAEGLRGNFTGWGPTLVGYSFQGPPLLRACLIRVGAGKYGLYEVFKKKYADIVGEETAHKYRTTLYLTASASAEFFADMLLCPWEAIKVRMQTTIPPFARGTMEGWNKITSTEGVAG
jgi:solute carrier family 25 phosphate transporter 3